MPDHLWPTMIAVKLLNHYPAEARKSQTLCRSAVEGKEVTNYRGHYPWNP